MRQIIGNLQRAFKVLVIVEDLKGWEGDGD
jgi:hypothetical protein